MDLLTRKELAQELKITERTVDNWRAKGMPTIKVGGVIRFDKAEIKKWLDSQGKEAKQ